MAGFDVDAARKAGYSDDEILQEMSAHVPSFDVGKAKEAGYSAGDIVGFLQQEPAAAGPHYFGNTTISSAPSGGIPGWAQDAMDDIRYGGERTFIGKYMKMAGYTPISYGVSSQVGEFMGGPALGPLKVVKGVGELPSKPLQGAGDILGGIGQATGPFTAVLGGSPVAKSAAAALEVPGATLGRLLPSMERAGQALNEVAQSAHGLPVDMAEPGKILLDMQRLNKTGQKMPQVAKLLAQRIKQGSPIPFEEARDFVTSARVSQGEFNNLTPQMQRLLSQLGTSLHSTISETADTAGGLGEKYLSAVNEYRKAIALSKTLDKAEQLAVKSAISGAGGAAGIGGAYGIYRTFFE